MTIYNTAKKVNFHSVVFWRYVIQQSAWLGFSGFTYSHQNRKNRFGVTRENRANKIV